MAIVSCAHDSCHSFEEGSGHRKYCLKCGCKRKVEADKGRVLNPNRKVTCTYDACCTWTPKKGAHNSKYCQEHHCRQKVEMEAKKVVKQKVRCEHDGCHEFIPNNRNHKYCSDCGCRIKAKAAADTQTRQLFQDPRDFRLLNIRRLPDGTKILICNDLHVPFQDIPTVTAVKGFWTDFKPDIEVWAGDVFDFYAVSEFDQNPSRMFTLQDEIDEARGELYARVTINPDARRVFIGGNHEDRMRRWLWKHGKDLSSLTALKVEELLGLNEMGFEYLNYMSKLDLLGFLIEHGHRSSKSAAFPTNVARLMAIATGSSGYCGHTHRFNHYGFSDFRGSHSYIEGGCLCLLRLEYAPDPNWQQAFTYGVVHQNRLHLIPVRIYPDGFRAEGEFYPRKRP